MEQNKPFKTIEVIDSDTKQVCKIACMSCIRGHRTTSCGIPVCRTKIFWTVKRPGRPANSCTCRYAASGGCKCVTAIAKCPHKSKKGEKRSSECRCDEQGRFCCLLEPEHWDALMALKKPTIDFFPGREAMEARQLVQTPITAPSTPGRFPTTPQQSSNCCGTPTPQIFVRNPRSIAPGPHDSVMSPASTTVTPRFGFMGVGAPMGSSATPSADVMAWNDDVVPLAPRDYTPTYEMVPEPVQENSCCQGPRQSHSVSLDGPFDLSHEAQYSQATGHFTQPYADFHTPETNPISTFDFDRWNQDYYNYQFPSAICQSCGLNGCTCRSCPPVMQNYGTTSWAQCCGRKHAQAAPTPMPMSQLTQTSSDIPPPQTAAPIDFIQPTHMAEFDNDFTMTDDADTLVYSDLILSELDRPSREESENLFGS